MNFSELLVVLIVTLLVFPSKKIPELAQTLGRCIRIFQAFKTQLFSTLDPIQKKLTLEDNNARAEKAKDDRAT